MRRLVRILRRLFIITLVLLALGVGAFTWLFYWPLEGSVANLAALLPYDVEFAVRFSWDDILATGWPQENVSERPVHPALEDWVEGKGAFRNGGSLPDLRARIDEFERTINDRIPLEADWARFDVERDVLGGEALAAGLWCQNQDPRTGPPAWQELLLLKRVSWRTKMVAALRHGFVRDRLAEDPTAPKVEPLADGVFRLTFPDIPISSEVERSTCGRGFVMPPENVWYLRRIRDVLALSNSERLIDKVSDLSHGGGESFLSRPGFQLNSLDGGIAMTADVTPLHRYLTRFLDFHDDLRLGIVTRFLKPRSLEKMNARLTFTSRDLLQGRAETTYLPSEVTDVGPNVYSLAPRPIAEGIAQLVPARGTFLTFSLRCEPLYLLRSIYAEALSPSEKQLWRDNLRRMGGYKDIDEFFVALAGLMGDTATVAVGRLDEIYDGYEYAEWFSADPDPMPAFAVMIKVREGKSLEEVNAFLSERVPLLGFASSLKPETYEGHTYTRMALEHQPLDLAHVDPAYLLVQDHLVLVNNERYLRQILDTLKAGPDAALAADDTWRQTMAALPERAHFSFFVDLEKVFRIPDEVASGAGPRGYAWDLRNQYVITEHDYNLFVDDWREEARRNFPPPLSVEQIKKIEREVDERVAHHQARYPEFLEEYRRRLAAYERLRGFGFGFTAEGGTVDVRGALLLDSR